MYFNNTKNQYIALIGDIVYSKRLENRKEVQEKFKAVIRGINEDYKDDIASKLMITLGDEFQGLFHKGKNLIRITEEIEYKMHPVKIRFGLGIGEITTDIIYEIPLGADGPAYYNAREMIDRLKTTGERLAGNSIKLKSGNSETDQLINTVFNLLSVVKNNFTERQREVVHYVYTSSASQKEAAERFNISQAAVNRILKNADYYQYKDTMRILEKVMGEIGEDV